MKCCEYGPRSTVVEHSSDNSEIGGSNHAAGNGRKKITKKYEIYENESTCIQILTPGCSYHLNQPKLKVYL